jgi:hypothetical protein
MNRVILLSLTAVLGWPQAFEAERNLLVKLRVPIGNQVMAKGDLVTASVFSPETFLGAVIEGTIEESRRGANARLRVAFHVIRHKNREIPVASLLIGFVNSKRHEGVDDADRPVRVDRGALVAAAPELWLDEGAELRLRVSPRN